MEKIIGNWKISTLGIDWIGEPAGVYPTIEKDRLLELRQGTKLYDWLLHMPQKTWVTRKDALDLNEAFIYVLKMSNISYDDDILRNTLELQKRILDQKGFNSK